MTTSAISTFNLSRDALIKKALKRVGVTNPSQDELLDAASSLNSLVKKLDVTGNWLWAVTNTETTLNVIANQASYGTSSVPPTGIPKDMMRLEAIAIMQGLYRYYLRILDKFESVTTMEKDRTGMPLYAYLEKGVTADLNKLWLFPKASQAYTCVFTYRRRLYDFTQASDNPDFPQEWFMPLSLYLASDLADSYGLDLQERQWLNQRAVDEIKTLKGANFEEVVPPVLPLEYF